MALNIDGTTGISGVDGSASAPALQGTDSNTGINFGSDTVNINTGGQTRATVDSSGRLLLGTTTEGHASADDLTVANSGSGGITIRSGTSNDGNLWFSDGTSGDAEYRGYVQYEHANDKFNFGTAATTRLVIDSLGNVGFGTTPRASTGLHISRAGGESKIELQRNETNTTGNVGVINFTASDGHSVANIGAYGDGDNEGAHLIFKTTSAASDNSPFSSTTERMRINSSGDVTINNTGGLDAYRLAGAGSSLRGVLMLADGRQANTTTQSQLHTLNRLDDDGSLITFSQNGNQEGNISVSGSSVSYNGGHLSRWSQLKGISSTDKSARPTIYQGTVMSNLDDLCEWTHSDVLYKEDVLYKKGDTIPEGKSEGDIKHAKGSVLRAAYTEENQQLNMTKISDTVGDKDVAGVFWAWDDEDDEIVNDFYIAMTGDMVIRVAASTTVARGDLMISAGDGTAKPQDDDIVRSSTIAKIISTTFTATYEDGSKAYPCVLMAC